MVGTSNPVSTARRAIVTTMPLSASVHAIFQLSNFDSTIQYARVSSAAHLASRFLTIREIRCFFWALLIGSIVNNGYQKRNGFDYERPPYYLQKKSSNDFTEQDDRDLTSALESLAKHVKFTAGEVSHPTHDGETETLYDTKAELPFKGYCARIHLNVANLPAGQQHDRAYGKYVIADIQTAITLIHELAHAARVISRPAHVAKTTSSVFVHLCASSEEGFEIENILRGGILEIREYTPPDMLPVQHIRTSPYPNKRLYNEYANFRLDFELAGTPANLQPWGYRTCPLKIEQFESKLADSSFWVEVQRRGVVVLHELVWDGYRSW